jgi:hypothetical protein
MRMVNPVYAPAPPLEIQHGVQSLGGVNVIGYSRGRRDINGRPDFLPLPFRRTANKAANLVRKTFPGFGLNRGQNCPA